MPDVALIEEPLHFGDGGRLLGILTLPGTSSPHARELPLFVFLNAGLLHHVGPHRLHVRLARELGRMGFRSLRLDLAGRGDSAARPGLTNAESLAADFEDIVRALTARVGNSPIVVGGLCSGADGAIRLAPHPRVIGLVLLDPICFPDKGFATRSVLLRYASPSRYLRWLKRQLQPRPKAARGEELDPLTLRDLPTAAQLQSAFEHMRERGGRVLSVFTHYALPYYKHSGQLRRSLGLDDHQRFSTELFWPNAEHTYTLDLHRRQLINVIKTWAADYLSKSSMP
jgi:hypothetical protein